MFLNYSTVRRNAAALLAFGVIAACSRDGARADSSGSAARRAAHVTTTARTDDSAAGSVDLGGSSYRPGPLGAVGSVAGTIKLDGSPPPDTAAITIDQPVCGTKADSPVSVSSKTAGISNAIVWVADVKTGKPFPIEKRAELASQNCELGPRVQGVVVGTTVNVFNDDKALHRLVFMPMGTHDTLTVMPFFNTGQVVASERLAKTPGIVEVRCARHPWMRGYIAVFDHPYFAVTEDDGSFKIDSLPPGTYRMMVWHEGMAKPAEQQVTVAANGTAKVELGIQVH